ncbi:hypothetical protein, partial [Shewanella algae]|uniref:hypothetical protein n=1 Tax=Shewanella algae TaxID=38313 RepID=UPI001F22650A
KRRPRGLNRTFSKQISLFNEPNHEYRTYYLNSCCMDGQNKYLHPPISLDTPQTLSHYLR